MCEIGSQGITITNVPDEKTESKVTKHNGGKEFAKSVSWRDAVNIIGSKGKKAIVVMLTIIVITVIWTSLVACGVSVFLLDRIEPNNNSRAAVLSNTSTGSFDNLPIVYIFVSKIFKNDLQILTEVYEIHRHELNSSNNRTSINFTVPDCNTTAHSSRENCSIQDILIAYLFPPLLTAPKVITSENHLFFDFSDVSFAKDVTTTSSVIVLDSNATNSSNTLQTIIFGLNINCPEDYHYDSIHHYCVPNNFIERLWHPSGNTGRTILRIGIACISITGLVLSLVSLSTFLLRLFFEESATGSVKRQPIVQKFFNSILTPTLLFLYLFASFCVILLVILDLPDPSDTYQKQYETRGERILLNLYGALFHFGIFGFFFWVNFTLLNLLLTLLYPVEFNTKYKLRVWIVVTELVLSIAIPLLLVIITLGIREGYPYFPIYIWLIVTDSDYTESSLPSLALYFVPLIISCLSILTLTPLVVCKIKWNLINSVDLKIHKPKLSNLQYRLLLYAILMFLIISTLLTGLILYTMVYQSNTLAIFSSEFGCLTALRPASIYRNGNLELYNTTSDALKSMRGSNEVIYQYEEDCYRVEKTNSTHPGWLYIMEAFLIRILIICIFMVTLPSKSNYYTLKNTFSRILECCKPKKNFMSSQE